jgi:hypothetical protein
LGVIQPPVTPFWTAPSFIDPAAAIRGSVTGNAMTKKAASQSSLGLDFMLFTPSNISAIYERFTVGNH